MISSHGDRHLYYCLNHLNLHSERHYPNGSGNGYEGDEYAVGDVYDIRFAVFSFVHVHEHEELQGRLDDGQASDYPNNRFEGKGCF